MSSWQDVSIVKHVLFFYVKIVSNNKVIIKVRYCISIQQICKDLSFKFILPIILTREADYEHYNNDIYGVFLFYEIAQSTH